MNLPRAESLEATASVFLLAWLLVFFAWRKLYRHYWGLAAVILVDLANRLLWLWETLVAFSPGHFHFYAWGYYVLDVLELAALTLCVYQLARSPGSRS